MVLNLPEASGLLLVDTAVCICAHATQASLLFVTTKTSLSHVLVDTFYLLPVNDSTVYYSRIYNYKIKNKLDLISSF